MIFVVAPVYSPAGYAPSCWPTGAHTTTTSSVPVPMGNAFIGCENAWNASHSPAMRAANSAMWDAGAADVAHRQEAAGGDFFLNARDGFFYNGHKKSKPSKWAKKQMAQMGKRGARRKNSLSSS